MSATATTHVICTADELPPGSRRIVTIDGRSIGVFNVEGELYAIRNSCPHRGAPLCEGTLGGTMLPSDPHTYVYGLENRLLRCPWHGWEIDIATGRPKWNNAPGRARTYRARVDQGRVVVEI
jgi:nitrite reductase (NADH) small subunit